MRALSASELLAVWERGQYQSVLERALLLLAAACPESPAEAIAKLSLGKRDARLLCLREWVFGRWIASLANCPSCGERLELALSTSDLRVHPPEQSAEEPEPEPLSINLGDHEVRFRLPNSQDLVEVSKVQDHALARILLLEHCLVGVYHQGRETAAGDLPEEVITAITERMEQADPQANVQLALSCPTCSHEWQAAFDIVSFFWVEIHAWAIGILREVHALALAYGWREADILAMTPARRQAYLGMISR